MSTSATPGPLGQNRGVAFVIIIGFITLGFYWWYWAFKTQDEMKKFSGDGLGGVLGLVIWILLGIVTAFTIPSEVGNLYGNAGRNKPLTGWTGLWLFLPIIGTIIWFVRVQGRLNDFWEAGDVVRVEAAEDVVAVEAAADEAVIEAAEDEEPPKDAPPAS